MHESEMCALEVVRLLSNKNLDYLLELFEEDALVYEPFSREGMLNRIGEIAPFLKVVYSNPTFLFSRESTRITFMKYTPKTHKVQVATEKPNNCLLDIEFGECPVIIRGKKLRKIKKLRIDTMQSSKG